MWYVFKTVIFLHGRIFQILITNAHGKRKVRRNIGHDTQYKWGVNRPLVLQPAQQSRALTSSGFQQRKSAELCFFRVFSRRLAAETRRLPYIWVYPVFDSYCRKNDAEAVLTSSGLKLEKTGRTFAFSVFGRLSGNWKRPIYNIWQLCNYCRKTSNDWVLT